MRTELLDVVDHADPHQYVVRLSSQAIRSSTPSFSRGLTPRLILGAGWEMVVSMKRLDATERKVGSDVVSVGLKVLPAAQTGQVREKRAGLVPNPTGVMPSLRHVSDAWWEHSGTTLRKLFGPALGLHAGAANGVRTHSGIDRRAGVPVRSLYGEQVNPTPEQLRGLDQPVFDMHDVGARYLHLRDEEELLPSGSSGDSRATSTHLDHPTALATSSTGSRCLSAGSIP
jgi:hypothetical protein